MPPRTRGTKTSKAFKENIQLISKTKSKPVSRVAKPRKALSDKTNSASDDNGSIEIAKGTKSDVVNVIEKENIQTTERPRRDRRAPNRLVESGAQKTVTIKEVLPSNEGYTQEKTTSNSLSPFKTPQKDADNSLLANRPRRVHRLPSRFDDHSVSPNRFIPVGTVASTPILQLKVKKPSVHQDANSKNNKINILYAKPSSVKETEQVTPSNKKSPIKQKAVTVNEKPISDTNNNARQRSCRAKKVAFKPVLRQKNGNDSSNISPSKTVITMKYSPYKNLGIKISPAKKIEKAGKQLSDLSFSFRVLEDKKKPSKRDNSHLDVYEFTYDPNEEPPPQKKKRKKIVNRKPAKPKTFISKNNYDRNVSKALAALKKAVSKKPIQPTVLEKVVEEHHKTPETNKEVVSTGNQNEKVPLPNSNHASVQIEDIAADFDPLPDHHDIDYSPVNSPNHEKFPQLTNKARRTSIARSTHDPDPLNLRDDLSFFDDIPVASSSMNVSVRRPDASPWRVEFGQLPIKWHVNTYVKSNMTPAVESSFINFEDNKNTKKHVYTNLVPETHDVLPELVQDQQPNLKQASIISFIKEVAERSASKRKRAKSITPTKTNSIFEESNMSATHKDLQRTPKKTPRGEVPYEYTTPNRNESENNTPSSKEKEKELAANQKEKIPAKSTNKEKHKDGTFFGFDDSEDQENVSPVKIDNPRVRALRPRARAVLQEINAQPSRVKGPLAAKSKIVASSDAINKVYEEIKSAADAPVFPEKTAMENVATTNVEAHGIQDEMSDDDSDSVHLFEDIELIHHLKPTRKSYGKAKKVTFRQASTSDSETQANYFAADRSISSGEDDLGDLTFTMPNVEQKSKRKKKVVNKKKILSKKEKAEVEAWAAGFNSMCEDIEEFPLLVE